MWPSSPEHGRLSAAHGPPLLGLRWLGWPIAPRTSLDPETNRGSGAKDQQENDDPDHDGVSLPPSPAGMELATTRVSRRARDVSGSTWREGEPGTPVTVMSLAARQGRP